MTLPTMKMTRKMTFAYIFDVHILALLSASQVPETIQFVSSQEYVDVFQWERPWPVNTSEANVYSAVINRIFADKKKIYLSRFNL
jgi:hypothetical protein